MAYVVVVSVSASIVVAGLLWFDHGLGNPAAVIGLALVAAYGERGRIRLRGNLDVSISLLPAIFAAVLFGPLAAMAVFGGVSLRTVFPVDWTADLPVKPGVDGCACCGCGCCGRGVHGCRRRPDRRRCDSRSAPSLKGLMRASPRSPSGCEAMVGGLRQRVTPFP